MRGPLPTADRLISAATDTGLLTQADESLARTSNLLVYAVMGLLALAMLAFAADLGARRSQLEKRLESERVLVGSGGPDTTSPPGDRPGDSLSQEGRVPATRWARIGNTLTVLAAVAILAAVALRGLAVHRWPLGNMYEFALVFSLVALVGYVVWVLARPVSWLGLFVTAPVLVVLHMAVFVWYTDASQLLPSLRSVWLSIHVGVATVATGVCVVAAVLAGLFLARDRQERAAAARPDAEPARRRGILEVLPRSRTLERLSYGLNVVGFPLWTFVLISGAIWAEYAWGRYWGWDPKEVWTFVVWVVYAAYLHARATASTSLRRATWIGIAGCLCIIANYTIVNTFFVGMHSYSGV